MCEANFRLTSLFHFVSPLDSITKLIFHQHGPPRFTDSSSGWYFFTHFCLITLFSLQSILVIVSRMIREWEWKNGCQHVGQLLILSKQWLRLSLYSKHGKQKNMREEGRWTIDIFFTVITELLVFPLPSVHQSADLYDKVFYSF